MRLAGGAASIQRVGASRAIPSSTPNGDPETGRRQEKEPMATITVIVGDAPYGKQRVYTALRFLLVALHEGHQANLFLLEDAVFAAKRGQQPPEMPVGDAGMPNCEELLRVAMQEGLTVKACRVCCTERGLQPEQVMEGVEISSMVDLVNWVVESDRTVFF
jgi:tRNA 2-thiouridine synthesizing protein D